MSEDVFYAVLVDLIPMGLVSLVALVALFLGLGGRLLLELRRGTRRLELDGPTTARPRRTVCGNAAGLIDPPTPRQKVAIDRRDPPP